MKYVQWSYHVHGLSQHGSKYYFSIGISYVLVSRFRSEPRPQDQAQVVRPSKLANDMSSRKQQTAVEVLRKMSNAYNWRF